MWKMYGTTFFSFDVTPYRTSIQVQYKGCSNTQEKNKEEKEEKDKQEIIGTNEADITLIGATARLQWIS